MSERRLSWAARKRQARQAIALCAVLVATGCGGDSGPDVIDVQGSYTGTIQGSGSSGQMQLTLVESAGVVTGSGSLSSASDAVAVTVTGTYTQPSLSMILHAPGFEDINVSGQVTATKITGSANGSGFVNGVVDLTRQ